MATNNNIIGAGIIFIIILIIYQVSTWNTSSNEDYLYGCWIADNDEFCKESGVESIMMFIGEPEGFATVTRICHIVIMNDVTNQGFTMTYRRGWSGPTIRDYYFRADITFEDEQIWPKNLHVCSSMLDGTLTICDDDDVIYVKLQKQHDISNGCK